MRALSPSPVELFRLEPSWDHAAGRGVYPVHVIRYAVDRQRRHTYVRWHMKTSFFFFLLRTLFSYMPNQAVMNLSLSYSGIYWRLFLVSSSYRYIEKNPYICYTSNLSPPCSCRVLAVLNMHCFTVYTLLLWQPKVCWKYGPNKRRNNRFALAVFICLDGSFPISCLSCFAQVREPKSE